MRFSEFSGKEIINLDSGERIGVVAHSDLIIDPVTGDIQSMLLPETGVFSFSRRRADIVIPWESIRKIGAEMIIVEVRQRGVMR